MGSLPPDETGSKEEQNDNLPGFGPGGATGDQIDGYEAVLNEIAAELDNVRRQVARAVNSAMTSTYWEIGRRIVELEQRGQTRSELYGRQILDRLSADLSKRFGRGFSRPSLYRFRAFYLMKDIVSTPLRQSFPLSWSHYLLLMAVHDPSARAFYEDATIRHSWSRKKLDRQISTNSYERMQLSKNKAAYLKKIGTTMPDDAVSAEAEIKDHFVTEFLDLKDDYSESDLEQALINDLENFLLELGNDFTFWARQKPCRIGDDLFRVDLVFYHRRLRCLVLIDLKIDKLSHADVGQMNLYVNYAKEHWTNPDENHPVGLILCAAKSEAVAKYALANLPHIKAREYQHTLPDPQLLEDRLRHSRQLLLELGKRGKLDEGASK